MDDLNLGTPLMKLPNNYIASLEAIAFQFDEKFYSDLVGVINELRKGELSQATLDSCGFAKVVYDHTNITIIPHLEDRPEINARTQTPSIDKNHPLLVLKSRTGTNFHGQLVIKYVKEKLGWVDLAKSRVHGFYSKLGFHMFLYKGLLDPSNSDEEVASLLLHEVGHIMTYFEYLGTVGITNYALATTAMAMVEAPDRTTKVRIIEEGIDGLGLDVNTDDLIQATDPEVVQVILSDAFVRKQRSVLGSDIYDMTGWEFLSDQFAVRHGAGRALVTIMDKVAKESSPFSYSSNANFLAMEAIKLSVFLISNYFTAGISTIFYVMIGIFFNPMSDLYDTPRDRTTRIKLQVTEALKDKKLTTQQRQRYLDDLLVIENIESTIKNRRSLFQFILTSLIPTYRRQWQQTVVQKKLEELANNSLFVSAAKLKNFTS